MFDHVGSTHELKYQFVDRMLNYMKKSLELTSRAAAYHHLVFDSVWAIAPVSTRVRASVCSLLSVARLRLDQGDYYNARLFIEKAIKQMQHGKEV